MKRLRTVAMVGALLAIVVAPLAYAGGLWFGLPVVGGASYCAGASVAGVPGTTATCNSTAPAGPTSTTGNELIPADLNPQGTPGVPGTSTAGVQTGYLPLATAASGAYLLTQPTGLVNMTLVVPNGITNVVQNLTGTMTTYALILPVNPFDGQLVRFVANATISTLFITTGLGSTATVNTMTKVNNLVVGGLPPVAVWPTGAVMNGFSYLYNSSNNIWYRLQ